MNRRRPGFRWGHGKANAVFIAFFLSAGLGWGEKSSVPPTAQETVVLIHGIVNRPFVMVPLQKRLEKEGFRVLNWGYSSTEKKIEDYAADLKEYVVAQQIPGTVHFVGFSLGSMIARAYLSTCPPANAGRFVQIAPPNQGSPLIDRFENVDAFHWIFGDKAIQQLKPGNPFLQTLKAPNLPFGIIAGGRGKEGFSPLIPGDDDGSVPLANAALDGAEDFIRVKREHTLLLATAEVHREVAVFLKTGRFSESADRP